MSLKIALIGNQNCGKTTLFNQLTGSNQHVGNFPGVTVEKKEGCIKHHNDVTVVDLPGIYSLSPYTNEEIVTRDFLLNEKPDCIINIIDATNIERNLYLTLQLLELNIPIVVALNMMDEVRANHMIIDIPVLRDELGIHLVPIAANKNEGVSELAAKAIKYATEKRYPKRNDFCSGVVHKSIHSIAHIIEASANELNIPIKFAATKVVEGDNLFIEKLHFSEIDRHIIEHIIVSMENDLGLDREAAMADMRYQFIEKLCQKAIQKKGITKEQERSVKIDKILTHKILAIPIFLTIMLLIFWLTFGVIGAILSDWLSIGIENITELVDNLLTNIGTNTAIHSLIIDGIFSGVGSVLSFLPTIVVLFFFLSLLEDSGYMARIAFVMDRLLRKLGLSGRSFVPLLIGFGCSVPAIMSTRTLSSDRDRKLTILFIPFISCSAKLPIYTVFTLAFFEKYRALVMLSLYILGIIVGIISCFVLKLFLFKGNPVPFVMELPAYRFPAPKSVLQHMWEKAKDFIIKAFTIIFLASIIIWLLQSFDYRFNLVTDSSDSILASIGRFIAPIFKPLGFGNWRASTALLVGITAKEAVVSTLAILLGITGSGNAAVAAGLSSIFTPLTAISFLVFSLLYVPCVAAFAAVKRELGSLKGGLLAMLYQLSVAFLVSFLVYNIGKLIMLLL